MHNKTSLVLFFTLSALILATLACSLVQPAKPTPTATSLPAAATAVPTKIVTAPTETIEPPAQTSLDGTWQGKTSADTDFEIQVKDNQITYFNFDYQIETGSCSASGGFGDVVSAPIIDNKFTVEFSDGSRRKVSITGTFISDTQATGTLNYSDKNEICGDIGTQMAWSVLSEGAVAAGTAVVPPPTQASKQNGFNGEWEGKNSNDDQVSFTVTDNQITYVMLNYSVNANGCSLGGAVNNSPKSAAITAKSFTVEFKDSDGRLFTFAGKFTSDTEASGTIGIKGNTESFCGAFVTEIPWTAKDISATDISDSIPTATLAGPTPSDSPTAGDPITIVDGFFKAITAGNIEAALVFADDNLIFSFGSAMSNIGKDDLKAFLSTQKAAGITYTLSNYSALGENLLNFSARASDGTFYASSQAILSDGKIVILTLK